ncbi:hypothetical protein [Nitrospirillum sp. BR 11163]|uniref:hypothetical protein n=1 Tax=Nitrospirillum sp. BR 11163 TaxID=3104323 RepID=UPI002AFF98BE|nr:hypothetical protein [Nitrospirillum sp. BR 11163]MEA1673227.1 hypothetical protein [Nitrospirillum sp. BR 11163]
MTSHAPGPTPPSPNEPRRGTTSIRKKDIVREASEDSFPASDPPAWTGVCGTCQPGEKTDLAQARDAHPRRETAPGADVT